MSRWIWVVLLLAVAVYGWWRTAELRERGAHEVVVVNRSGRLVEDLRIHVGGKEVRIPALPHGATAKRPLLCERDGAFEFSWRSEDGDREMSWQGGRFSHGPIAMRHRFELVGRDGVVWRTERIATTAPREKPKRRR